MGKQTAVNEESNYTPPIYIRLDKALKARIVHQCKRLNLTQNGFAKMALSKLVEEEEQIEASRASR